MSAWLALAEACGEASLPAFGEAQPALPRPSEPRWAAMSAFNSINLINLLNPMSRVFELRRGVGEAPIDRRGAHLRTEGGQVEDVEGRAVPYGIFHLNPE